MKRRTSRRNLNGKEVSIDSVSDGRRKFLNPHIVRMFSQGAGGPKYNAGPFYLTHPDLQQDNRSCKFYNQADPRLGRSMHSILPFEDTYALPRCLSNHCVNDLLSNSPQWQTFRDRSKSWSQLFADVARSNIV